MIGAILNRVPNADKAVFSVHCHNDLGLAVANSLSAVMQGARQVECTINGLGERAGNAALEEVVMAIRTRQDLYTVDTQIDTRHIVPASRLVSSITGFPVQPNKAIVGANAFAHESGIHQDGVLKHRETYEIMLAEDVGWHANRMVLGKHSGRNAFKTRLQDLGYAFASDTDLAEAFARFKTLADKKHDIFDEDLHALMAQASEAEDELERIKLKQLSSQSDMGSTPKARVVLEVDGREVVAEAYGDGPVDACFKAVDSVVRSGTQLQLYSVNAITSGTEAQGEVSVRLEKAGRIVNGAGSDTDIIVASAKAYIRALNLMLNQPQKAHPQITV
jgi:2-isopropylmalate synthase